MGKAQVMDPSPMVRFLVVIIPALLAVVVAIFSIQNATPVAITFFNARTVALPSGLWLVFALAAGMVGTALLLSLFGKKKKKRF